MEVEIRYEHSKLKNVNVTASPTPPPLPPKPKFQAAGRTINKPPSLTNQEIEKYWRQKRMDEEDHLLAAIKAAARIHARNLSENDYQQFEESLKQDDDEDDSKENSKSIKSSNKKDESKYEIRVGIKDWYAKKTKKSSIFSCPSPSPAPVKILESMQLWTKSKYAYLNQPVTQSVDAPKRRSSSYTPQFFCLMSAPPPSPATPTFAIF